MIYKRPKHGSSQHNDQSRDCENEQLAQEETTQLTKSANKRRRSGNARLRKDWVGLAKEDAIVAVVVAVVEHDSNDRETLASDRV